MWAARDVGLSGRSGRVESCAWSVVVVSVGVRPVVSVVAVEGVACWAIPSSRGERPVLAGVLTMEGNAKAPNDCSWCSGGGVGSVGFLVFFFSGDPLMVEGNENIVFKE